MNDFDWMDELDLGGLGERSLEKLKDAPKLVTNLARMARWRVGRSISGNFIFASPCRTVHVAVDSEDGFTSEDEDPHCHVYVGSADTQEMPVSEAIEVVDRALNTPLNMEGLNISALKNSELNALREIAEQGQFDAILKMRRWKVVTAGRDPDRVILNHGRNTYEIHITPGGNLHIQATSDEGPLGQGVGDSAIITSIINDLQRRFGDKAAGPRGNTTNPLGRGPYGPIRLHLIGPDGASVDKITCSLSKWSADNIEEFINEDWELRNDLEVTCVAFSGNILTLCISNGEELQVWLPVGGLRMMIGAHVKSFRIRLYCD